MKQRMKTELWISIQTGFGDANPDNKYVEFTFKNEDKEKSVKIPFDILEKFPLNNTPVFFVKGRTKATPQELQDLIEDLKERKPKNYE